MNMNVRSQLIVGVLIITICLLLSSELSKYRDYVISLEESVENLQANLDDMQDVNAAAEGLIKAQEETIRQLEGVCKTLEDKLK